MDRMITHTKPLLAGLVLTSVVSAGTAHAVTVIFDDDFEDTTLFSGVSDAVIQTNLNAGVAVGTWTVADGQESKLQTQASNKGFVIDRGTFDVTAAFSQAGAVGPDATVISLDFHSSRENQTKDYFFIGLQGSTELFRITVNNPGGITAA